MHARRIIIENAEYYHMRGFFQDRSRFHEIANGDYYYVDKSLLIRDILKNGKKAFLFTRPRRFGKTTNLDMLDCFFNMDHIGESRVFEKLRIGQYPEYMSQRGRNRVIHMVFSDTDANNMPLFMDRFSTMISRMLADHRYILDNPDMDPVDRDVFDSLRNKTASESELIASVSYLCEWIHRYDGHETVIIVDEYDKPVQSAFLNDYYKVFMEFFSRFMESSFKTNADYRMAVIGGVSTVSKESIFGGMNNLCEIDIFDPRFDEYFGFTEGEVRDLLKEMDIPESEMSGIREYYDGYLFGNVEVYNPYSVMNHLENRLDGDGRLRPHWVSSGDTKIIANVISKNDRDFRESVISLGVPGNTMLSPVDLHMSFRSIQDGNTEEELRKASISLMVTSGYLKAIPEGMEYRVLIPNTEVFTAFESIVRDLNIIDTVTASKLVKAILSKDSDSASE